MQKVVVITKTGSCKAENIKNLNLATLYKKCKFRKADNFEKRATWKSGDQWVSVYARDTGRAGGENKYELPPPIDKELYFGSMLVLAHTTEVPTEQSIVDIDNSRWQAVYEQCMGGFEDLGAASENEEPEEIIPEHLKTSTGYMKDGFVVDDDEDDDCEEAEDSEGADYGDGTGDEEEVSDEDSDEDSDDNTGAASELSEEEYHYK